MSRITIPVPDPAQVAMVISDGTRFAMVHVNRMDLANNPAGAISAAMRTLEGGLSEARAEGLPGWTEVDVVQTERGYALSPSALDEVMRASFGEDYKEKQ